MRGTTHAGVGAVIGAAIALPCDMAFIGAVVGGMAALLPDVDHPASYIGRRFRPVACWLEERYGHRKGPTHTLLFAGAGGLFLGIVAAAILKTPTLVVSGLLGGLSHIALDGVTWSGVRPYRIWFPRLPARYEKRLDYVRKWNRFADRVTGHSAASMVWRGNVYTGKDFREKMLFAVSLVLLAMLLLYK